MGTQTDLIHHGERLTCEGSLPLSTPIYQTSTFSFGSAAEVERYQRGERAAFLYSRYENPTVVAVEEKIAALDGAETSLLFGSGMAATTTALMSLVARGEELVCAAAIYGGTFHLIEMLAARFGIERRFVSLEQLARPASILRGGSKVLWFETPINPTLRCVDVRAVTTACRAAGVLSCVDNTFASAINQPVLSYGADLSMQSVTKYLNGHSDVTGGVLSGSRALLEPIARTRRLLGGTMEAQPASLLGRGLKTLPLRIAQHNANALALAQRLQGHPGVTAVHYPGLPSHPDYEMARAQMRGFGGMVTIDLAGGQAAAYHVFDRLRVFKRAASLGGVESLCSLPVLTSQYGLDDTQLAQAGVTRGMMRFSVGLEDSDDLVADVEQALG